MLRDFSPSVWYIISMNTAKTVGEMTMTEFLAAQEDTRLDLDRKKFQKLKKKFDALPSQSHCQITNPRKNLDIITVSFETEKEIIFHNPRNFTSSFYYLPVDMEKCVYNLKRKPVTEIGEFGVISTDDTNYILCSAQNGISYKELTDQIYV